METKVSKSQFKAHALEIFRNIEATGQPVVITDNGTPALIVMKHDAGPIDPLTRLKGSVLRFDEPTAPIDARWEADA